MNRHVREFLVYVAIVIALSALIIPFVFKKSTPQAVPAMISDVAQATSTPALTTVVTAPPEMNEDTAPQALDVPIQPPAPSNRSLSAILVSRRYISAEDFDAYAGIANISGEQRREYELWLADPEAQAGPASLHELANVQRWIPGEVTQLDEKRLQYGPIEVPLADAYHVLAFDRAGNYFWSELPVLQDSDAFDAGDVHEVTATGIRLRLVHPLPTHDHYLVEIERRPDAQSAEQSSQLLRVLSQIRPELAETLIERLPLILNANEEYLAAPLPEDPAVRITVRLTTGQAAQPVEVGLLAGKIIPVALDIQKLFSAEDARTIDLQGRLLFTQTDSPVVNAAIRLLDSFDAREAMTDSDGRFRLESLPYGTPSLFEIEVMRPPLGLPQAAEMQSQSFTPSEHAPPDADYVEHEFRIPSYRWLVIELNDEARRAIAERSKFPYPIYILQKYHESGWRDAAADEFIPVEEGIAISLVSEDLYRAAIAVTPMELYYSEPGRAGADMETRVPLMIGAAEVRALPQLVQLIDRASAMPLASARVRLAGPHRSLPPMELVADSLGRIDLGVISGAPINLTVHHETIGNAEVVITLRELEKTGYIIEVRNP